MGDLNQKKKRCLITFIALVLSSVFLLVPLLQLASSMDGNHQVEATKQMEELTVAEELAATKEIVRDQTKREEIADGAAEETDHEKEVTGVEEADKREKRSEAGRFPAGELPEGDPIPEETAQIEAEVMQEPEPKTEPVIAIPEEESTGGAAEERSEPVPEREQESTAETLREVIAHEHSWIFASYYQEPDCSNGGLLNEICAGCGETQTTPGVPTGEHTFLVEVAGDCCSKEVVACKVCHHREIREPDHMNHIDVEDGFCYGCGQKIESPIRKEDYETITP